MSDQDTQSSKEAQKTIIAFIAGLLIGGLLVWVFGGTTPDTETENNNDNDNTSEVTDVDTDNNDADDTDDTDDTTDDDTDTSAPTVSNGNGSFDVNNQPAGMSVTLEAAVYPNDEGWIGVRDYDNGEAGRILGVARFSREQGLLPTTVTLLRPTVAGQEYAVVYFTESGDRSFSAANDMQIEGIMETFTAQ